MQSEEQVYFGQVVDKGSNAVNALQAFTGYDSATGAVKMSPRGVVSGVTTAFMEFALDPIADLGLSKKRYRPW